MGLLQHDTLVIDQVTNVMSNDFAISDADGQQVGSIRTEGNALKRMFLGSRRLLVLDDDGTALLRLEDTMTLGRDRMEITDGDGRPLASLVKRMSFLKSRITVVVDDTELDLTGNMWGFDFTMSGPRGELATVARSWSGLGKALLGHSRYVVRLTPGVPARERQAVLGSVIALDLIREKESRSNG